MQMIFYMPGVAIVRKPFVAMKLRSHMSVPAGTKLGVFEVSTLLSVGGMGEVYRARDTKLGRDVAIKILPAEFAHDRDRLPAREQCSH
jgi:serine/threonine protein kinase